MSGGIRKRDINLLLVVGGILIAVVAFFLGYKKIDEKTVSIQAQNQTLQQQVRRLDDISLKQDSYGKEMQSFEQDIASIVKKYPAEEREEDVILYAREMELKRELDVKNIQISKANLIYSLVTSTLGGDGSNTSTEQPAETETTGSSVDTELGIKTISEVSLPAVSLYSTVANYKFTVGYENIKACFADIYQHADSRNVTSIALSYDEETGQLIGDMSLNLYYLSGTDKVYKEPDAGVMLHGKDDLFGTIGAEETEPEVQ